jgi:hypothetical protein
MTMTIGVMVMRLHRRGCGAQFEQERSAARRHESDGDVSPEQQHCQQEAGQ